MQMLANEGIYVLFSLTPYAFLGAYDTAAYNYTKRVIDTVGIYSNTLGFYTGSPSASTTSAALAKVLKLQSSHSLQTMSKLQSGCNQGCKSTYESHSPSRFPDRRPIP